MKIYVGFEVRAQEAEAFRRLTAADDVWVANPAGATAADRAAFLEAEIVFGAFPTDLLVAATRLRWVQFSSVGIDFHRNAEWGKVAGRVVCTNLRGAFAECMAQTVLGAVLSFNRGLDQFVRLQERRDWQKDYYHPRLHILQGAHVLLLGNGSVTTRVRELLAQFGCTFTVYARTSGDIRSGAELDAALPKADIVCAALPDTPETRGLMSADRIARFKPGALFANVGRGSLVDEAALIEVLRSGQLRGAMLDVTRNEPLPPDDPLWSCPRTLLTQHTSAGSELEFIDAIKYFGENLARYRSGQPLQNVIDWSKGY